jgi:hypothetical protein
LSIAPNAPHLRPDLEKSGAAKSSKKVVGTTAGAEVVYDYVDGDTREDWFASAKFCRIYKQEVNATKFILDTPVDTVTLATLKAWETDGKQRFICVYSKKGQTRNSRQSCILTSKQ